MKKITVVLVDDERLAREEIKRHMRKYPDIDLLSEADNVDDALLLVKQYRPDVLLLDIQMPGKSGFELLEALDDVPEVIFVTAFDEYAVKAFEVNALDYLVKPVRDERFQRMVEKLRLRVSETSEPRKKQLFVKDGHKCHLIMLSDLFLVESFGNYVKLFFNDKTALLKRSMNQMETTLPSDMFFRASRSKMISLSFIQTIRQEPAGKLTIKLVTGQTIEASERQSARFRVLNKP